MATGHGRGTVRERGLGDRIQHLAAQANTVFAAGSILVPLVLTGVAAGLGSELFMLYVHVASGAVWFGLAMFLPAVIGPVLGGLDGQVTQQFTERFTPKMTFLIFGTSLTTVVSGTLLLTGAYGLGYGFTGTWSNLALGVGWGLWIFGLVVPNRLHLRAYYEGRSPNPDPEVLETVEKRNAIVGLFEAAVMLFIILIMVGLRPGGI